MSGVAKNGKTAPTMREAFKQNLSLRAMRGRGGRMKTIKGSVTKRRKPTV